MVDGAALYTGHLRHRRFEPRPHAFTYSLFLALLDIDRIDDAMRVSPFTSTNRFNWAAFDDRDHLTTTRLSSSPERRRRVAARDLPPLRERLRASASTSGLRLADGPIYLLTHLRYLGYNFNPISFFYCYDRAGTLDAVMAEVNSTFGQQCTYWLPISSAQRVGRAHQWRVPKTMHVSPFMAMHVDYIFTVTPPDETLIAHMETVDQRSSDPAPYFDATLTLERRPWNARSLHGALVKHPWMTAKVIAAIHWQAARLWWKGVPAYAPPDLAADDPVHEETEVSA